MSELEHKICPICGIEYAAPREFFKAKSDGCIGVEKNWHCPNGHSLIFTDREADRLRRERDRAIQDNARLEDEKREAERRAELAEARERRLKKRAAAGTCPCCKRTFSNMSTHMRKKHPEYVADNVVKLNAG